MKWDWSIFLLSGIWFFLGLINSKLADIKKLLKEMGKKG